VFDDSPLRGAAARDGQLAAPSRPQAAGHALTANVASDYLTAQYRRPYDGRRNQTLIPHRFGVRSISIGNAWALVLRRQLQSKR
jgi:hypothetical protein